MPHNRPNTAPFHAPGGWSRRAPLRGGMGRRLVVAGVRRVCGRGTTGAARVASPRVVSERPKGARYQARNLRRAVRTLSVAGAWAGPGWVLAVVITAALTTCTQAIAASPAAVCSAIAELGASKFVEGQALIKDAQGRGDTAFLTPSWALACLLAGRHVGEANSAIVALASRVAAEGPQAGLLPWFDGGFPSLPATEVAAPPLAAAMVLARDKLTAPTADALSRALDVMARRLAKAKPADTDVRTLALAAARAGVGRAADAQPVVDSAEALLDSWVRTTRKEGPIDGHGPTTEAYRLAALAWMRVFGAGSSPAWRQAWMLTWADLLQRLVRPRGLVCSAQLFAGLTDAADAAGPIPGLLAAAFSGAPAQAALDQAYFILPFRQRLAPALPGVDVSLPAAFTYTFGAQRPVIERTYLARELSLSTLTGPVAASSVPVLLVFPSRSSRPTVYLTLSSSCHAAAVQRGTTAVVNFDFDAIGRRSRIQAWVQFHLGRRADIKRVSVMGRPWTDQPIAVDRMAAVAVESPDVYVGLVPLWAGRAEARSATERVKPGVLEWSGAGDEAELVLRLYARQANYPLRMPEDNYVVGCCIVAVPSGESSFDDFVARLRGVRYRKEAQVRKWRVPKKDEGHPLLDRYKPKPKRAYYVERAYDYRLTCIIDKVPWVLGQDLYSEQVIEMSIGEETLPLQPGLLVDTPLLKLAPSWQSLPELPDLARCLFGGQ